ncbi:MAG: DUF262 domain-containing HNH endonuclease family protein [Candidatus Omnitrophota bacterium]
MSGNTKFKAQEKLVGEILFGSFYKFRIPRYQRPYAWGNDQISDFWNDLISEDNFFFIGTFIFNNEPLGKTGYIDIIDGQQRILSITIFIAVLRDILEKIDVESAKRYHRQDIAIEDRDGNESFRILCGDSTQDYFKRYIQQMCGDILNSSPKLKEHSLIKKNYEFLHKKVNDELKKYENKKDKINYLNGLRSKVYGLQAIHIQIESEEEAYEIFETTNARGIDLTIADLLKNLIFQSIKSDGNKDVAKDLWQDIVEGIQETDSEMKRFIRYFWISKQAFITEKKIFKAIKSEVTNWDKFLKDLHQGAEMFNKLLVPDKNDWKDIKNGDRIYKALFSISLMGVSQCYVLFLSILRNIDKLKTDPTRVFELIEKFTFQYSTVCRLPTNGPEKIYSKYALKIEKAITERSDKKIAGEIQSIFSNLENELRKMRPSSEIFKDFFEELEYKNSEKNRVLVKYILHKINKFYQKTKEQDIDFDEVNIEHILPQKPIKGSSLKRKDIKHYVNKLGNLTLVDKRINSRVGNKLVKDKASGYKESSLAINQELIKELKGCSDNWDEKVINKRQKYFAELIYKNIFVL